VVMSELMVRVCRTIPANANLVKQIVFPLETLVLKTVLASVIVQLLMSLVLLAALLFTGRAVSPIFVPLWILTLAIQTVFMLGFAFAFSAITPFVPDLEDAVALIARAGLFLAPVIYVPTMFSAATWQLFYLNPFSYFVWIHRDAVFYQSFATPAAWIGAVVIAVGSLALGTALFRRLSPSFGEAV
jgi:lipopolysaccharide transport system permease protein